MCSGPRPYPQSGCERTWRYPPRIPPGQAVAGQREAYACCVLSRASKTVEILLLDAVRCLGLMVAVPKSYVCLYMYIKRDICKYI